MASLSAKDGELPKWDSTEAESNNRAMESVKLPQEPSAWWLIMMVKSFPCFTQCSTCLTAPVVSESASLSNYLSLIPYVRLPYQLQSECSRPDVIVEDS